MTDTSIAHRFSPPFLTPPTTPTPYSQLVPVTSELSHIKPGLSL